MSIPTRMESGNQKERGAREKPTAFAAGVRFLETRARSTFEMRQYLERKGYSPQECDNAIESLAEMRYLDDAQFADDWVRSRRSSRGLSARALQRELLQKGVSVDIAAAALSNVGTEDEVESAIQLLAKSVKRQPPPRDASTKRRAIAAAMRRGHSFDTIESAWRRLVEEHSRED